jgi:Tfp pilus assembly protein PilF
MLQLIRRAGVLVAAALLFAGLSSAQMGTFMGKVIGVDGKGLKDAVITIDRIDIKGHWETKSNKKGDWIYSGMQVPGRYKITCVVGGKVADVVDGLRAQMGEPVEVNFDLKKVADKQAAMDRAMQSGQITEEMSRGMTPEQRAQMEKTMKERGAQLAKNKALQDAFNAGMEALQTKNYQAALDGFNKAAEVDPKQSAVWSNMAVAYEGLAAAKTGDEQTADLNKAVESYQKALELKPDEAGLHNNFGLTLAKLHKLDEAKAEFDKAAALNPAEAGKFYFNLGAILVNTRQDDAALDVFKKCTELDPKYANCWYMVGNVLSGKMTIQGDKPVPPAGMVEALQKYLELDPNGQNAEAAKGLLSVVQTTIETKYVNPDAGKKKKK